MRILNTILNTVPKLKINIIIYKILHITANLSIMQILLAFMHIYVHVFSAFLLFFMAHDHSKGVFL